MKPTNNIQTVKNQANINTPDILTGYLVNGSMYVPLSLGNRQYKEVQRWIAEGNTPESAYTQEELDAYAYSQSLVISSSMLQEGKNLTADHLVSVDVGGGDVIENKPAHDSWMQSLYADDTAKPKPPPTERQKLAIEDEDRDTYTFTRYHDNWGYRWRMELKREDITNLAVAIYDQSGGYLYTTGKLLPDGEGKWFTECPAGQADSTPEDVYYKWLLGAGDISGLQVYKGADDSTSGIVRSDERYD